MGGAAGEVRPLPPVEGEGGGQAELHPRGRGHLQVHPLFVPTDSVRKTSQEITSTSFSLLIFLIEPKMKMISFDFANMEERTMVYVRKKTTFDFSFMVTDLPNLPYYHIQRGFTY